MRDYIAYARTHPGELNFSTSGLGGVTHLCGELLHYMTKTNATFVHYKVSSQRLVDVTAGRVHASITAPVSALPMIKAGRLRALGITSAERIALLPDMPTIEKVAAGLNAIGVTPRDMMAIFQAMKQAGALQAELILR